MVSGMLFIGADGCSSDPNVEGAKLDMNNKDYDQALVNLEKALEKNPDNAAALAMKSQALQEKAFMTMDTGEHTTLFRESVDAMNKAGELGEDVKTARVNAYYREFERGVQAFNKGTDDEIKFEDAVTYFDNTSFVMPDSTDPYIYKGYAYLRQSDNAKAIEALQMGIKHGVVEVDPYVYLGQLLLGADRAAEAVTLLEEASGKWPDDADVSANLLNAYQTAGMIDRAKAKYVEGLERDPENTTYLYNLGSLLLSEEDYDGAVMQLEKATSLDPDYANAWYNLGAAYQNKAVAINEEISALDDKMRGNPNLSSEERRNYETQIDELAAQRKATFEMAITPLENAKRLTEGEGGDASGICVALYTAYVQTDQIDKAQGVSKCAGFEEE